MHEMRFIMDQAEYAVIRLPYSEYEQEMREQLGCVFDIAVNVAGCTGSQIIHALTSSGLSTQLEKLNPVYVLGKSAYDLIDIMMPFLPIETDVKPVPRFDRTPDYWLGWILGHFILFTGYSLKTIFERASYDELRSMYWPLHEAHESKFVEALCAMMRERASVTHLKQLREAAGLSQSQLSKASGVGLRSIQMYEQRRKDINKAQAGKLYALSWALRCPMEALLER